MAGELDEGLLILEPTAPEFKDGLSNHGPMGAEALDAMGRADQIVPWVERYSARLDKAPPPTSPIGGGDWRKALGSLHRWGDWVLFFERDLDTRAWADVLSDWGSRLLPGVMAGATHGLIRTAHAVRSLERDESEPRRRELAKGLAYWAARYQELPGRPRPQGKLALRRALEQLPRPPVYADRSGLIFRVVDRMKDVPGFPESLDAVEPPVSAAEGLSELTAAFAGISLANATPKAVIPFVHTVTAPAALRLLLPHLPEGRQMAAYAFAWQACAAVFAAYSEGDATPGAVGDGADVNAEQLFDEAAASGVEHAIKFTEACVRENRVKPDPVYLAAARDVIGRLAPPV